MIGNPVWGVLLNRTGVRRRMSAAVAIWTAASAAHALAGSFAGFGIALGHPGLWRGRHVSWRPAHRDQHSRSRATRPGLGIAYSGGSLLTPLLVTPIALLFGWREHLSRRASRARSGLYDTRGSALCPVWSGGRWK
jgi:MFS transporter, ACS family, hexuronate transporter